MVKLENEKLKISAMTYSLPVPVNVATKYIKEAKKSQIDSQRSKTLPCFLLFSIGYAHVHPTNRDPTMERMQDARMIGAVSITE